MNLHEYNSKFTIKDIETKTDKNFNPYYLIHFENSNYKYGYAFRNNLDSETLKILDDAPYNFINRLVSITYQLNQTLTSTFFQVKEISLIN
ncbi:MAG: hypothetical protein mread185_000583 [Mycoplasmataceae bacterium]|nr:MAG: hypothetical protein mread185_000583 [Mycoplasmataceae bacterium]